MSSIQRTVIILVSLITAGQCFSRPRGPQFAGLSPYENGVGSLCRVMCSRKDVVCPAECSLADLDMFDKRSVRVNRARKFGELSFDDYLFMKLLGRNLNDRD